MRSNTTSPIVLTKRWRLVGLMMSDGGRRIVNIASVAAVTGYSGLAASPPPGHRWSTSPVALFRPEVRRIEMNVNAVVSRFFRLDMTRNKKGMRPRVRARALERLVGSLDVVNAVEFLLDDRSKKM